MSTNQPRKPAGTPVGGQWAPMAHTEPEIVLGRQEQPQLQQIARGCWEVTDTTREELLAPNGLRRTAFYTAGQPHRRAAAGLAAKLYEQDHGDRDIEAELRELDGEKVTVLTRDRTGGVLAREGTVLVGIGTVALLDKGSRSKGIYLYGRSATYALDYRPGYGHAEELANEFRASESRVPELEPAHFEDIPVADSDGEPPSAVAAVFVMEHPGFDSTQDGRGCLFFATDRDPEEVVNGYFVAPPGSGLESEHGSFTTEMLDKRSGRVKDFEPGSVTFAQAVKFGDMASGWYDGDMAPAWAAAGVRMSARSWS